MNNPFAVTFECCFRAVLALRRQHCTQTPFGGVPNPVTSGLSSLKRPENLEPLISHRRQGTVDHRRRGCGPGLSRFRAETLEGKDKRVVVKTRRLLGVEPEWKHIRAGAFGESVDGLPTIGEVPGLKECSAVMGFGGNGTIYALIVAGVMPALLKGRVSAGTRLFAFADMAIATMRRISLGR